MAPLRLERCYFVLYSVSYVLCEFVSLYGESSILSCGGKRPWRTKAHERRQRVADKDDDRGSMLNNQSATEVSRSFAPSQDLPKWERLHRKETRLRDDQLSKLTELARSINRNKPRSKHGDDERITENTLIRVAVDIFLDHWDTRMVGANEEELLTSAKKHLDL